MMPQTKDAVCETLFVLCDKDGKYVKKWKGYKEGTGKLEQNRNTASNRWGCGAV